MSKPAKLKLTIYQGATFRKRLRWSAYPYPVERIGGVLINKNTGLPADPADLQPVDLTGCTARMQVRAEVESPTALLTLTTENGGITLGGATGVVDLLSAESETAAMTWDGGLWDLEVVHPGGDVTRLAEGSISVSPEVTRG